MLWLLQLNCETVSILFLCWHYLFSLMHIMTSLSNIYIYKKVKLPPHMDVIFLCFISLIGSITCIYDSSQQPFPFKWAVIYPNERTNVFYVCLQRLKTIHISRPLFNEEGGSFIKNVPSQPMKFAADVTGMKNWPITNTITNPSMSIPVLKRLANRASSSPNWRTSPPMGGQI